ncbi:hypothetical protein JW979_04150 [bacterium]|nr:hypothetical protein [candidate division CSSED10-310 bacterium]
MNEEKKPVNGNDETAEIINDDKEQKFEESKAPSSSKEPVKDRPIVSEQPKQGTSGSNDTIDKMQKEIMQFNPLTFVAAGIAFLFFIMVFIPPITIRWWIMLPFAAASIILFHMRKKDASGLELTVSRVGFWFVIVMFLIRDMWLSSKVASIADGFNAIVNGMRAFE